MHRLCHIFELSGTKLSSSCDQWSHCVTVTHLDPISILWSVINPFISQPSSSTHTASVCSNLQKHWFSSPHFVNLCVTFITLFALIPLYVFTHVSKWFNAGMNKSKWPQLLNCSSVWVTAPPAPQSCSTLLSSVQSMTKYCNVQCFKIPQVREQSLGWLTPRQNINGRSTMGLELHESLTHKRPDHCLWAHQYL